MNSKKTNMFKEKDKIRVSGYLCVGNKKMNIFAHFGEMAEWSKAHAWKVCNRQKRFMGSNPILSAMFYEKVRFICIKLSYL